MKSKFLFILVLVPFLGLSLAQAASDEAVEQNNKGVELLKQGKIKEALGPLIKAVELNPKDTDIRMNLGYAYDREGRVEEAILQYQKVIEMNPRNSIAHNNLGVLYDRNGRNDEAIRKFQKVLEIDPNSATGPNNLETAKSNQSLIREQERQIAEALKKAEADPQNPSASYKLARLYAAYGKKDQAVGWLEKALKLGFNDIGYLKTDAALDSLRNEPDYVWLLRGR